MKGPFMFISNLLTEGSGMDGFTASRRRAPDQRGDRTAGRCRWSTTPPVLPRDVLDRYAAEHKRPLELRHTAGRMRADRRGFLAR